MHHVHRRAAVRLDDWMDFAELSQMRRRRGRGFRLDFCPSEGRSLPLTNPSLACFLRRLGRTSERISTACIGCCSVRRGRAEQPSASPRPAVCAARFGEVGQSIRAHRDGLPWVLLLVGLLGSARPGLLMGGDEGSKCEPERECGYSHSKRNRGPPTRFLSRPAPKTLCATRPGVAVCKCPCPLRSSDAGMMPRGPKTEARSAAAVGIRSRGRILA